tara:strand:+ start:470 stop:802 length:333 start_codon:yes stop_codon:yes gene_type:complete
MRFLDSEIVQKEMQDIETLQKKVYGNVFNFPNMDREDKMKHIEILEELINKQQIFYKRLSLSDDPKAKEIRNTVMESAEMFGFKSDGDLSLMFAQIAEAIKEMRKQLDKS